MKQKLWLISELFPPEETSTGYIMGEIANALACKYDVTVVCGPTVYDKNKKQDIANEFILDSSIKLIRVDTFKENKASKLSKIKKFLLMSKRLYAVVNKEIKDGDKVFMVSNPFPLILMMGHLRKKRSFELTMLVHDVFPEGLFTDMNLPGFMYTILGRLFNKAYAKVDTLVSLGRDMTEVMQRKVAKYANKGQRIVQIENWGDITNIQPKAYNEFSDKIVVEYAGNIGHAQGVFEFLKLVEQVKNPHLKFSIWGTGSESEEIQQYIKDHSLTNVLFNGPYFRSQQNDVLNACDIALITLVDGMYGLGVPSKSYNIMAAGKPILFIGDLRSEIALTVKENNLGYCFDSKDVEGLSKFLQSLHVGSKTEFVEKGVSSRHIAESKYSKEVILDEFVELV